VRRFNAVWTALFVSLSFLLASAQTPFKTTTTLTAETANNTSATSSFTTQTNGNTGANNISKVSIRSLLYQGSTAKIYTHFMPWFGFGDHMNVGYTSNDAAQVQKQVVDMASRGLDGTIVDWYGRGTMTPKYVFYDQATTELMHEAEQHAGFQFAIQHDAGALKACAATSGCDMTQTLIDDLNYAFNAYEHSTAYLLFNGRPVVYFFGHEKYTLDWNRVRSSVAGNPLLIFRNASGFQQSQSNGAFSWMAPEIATSADPIVLSYLDNFYKTALSQPTTFSTGSAYKGFDDSLAAWTAHRLMPQDCGQTWLTTFAESGKFYSASRQMLGIQITTWNDYEEGTEIESGIDNCVTISASVSGQMASWSITGQANTIDHYTVFASQDGTDLMPLLDLPSGTMSLDLSQFQLPAGSYTIYVKAVGKASMTNKMSAGAQFTAATVPSTGPSFQFATSGGTSATVSAGQTAVLDLKINSANGFVGAVAFSCSGAPAGVTCSVNPGSINLTASSSSSPLSVTIATSANAGLSRSPFERFTILTGAIFLPVFGSIVFRHRRKAGQMIMLTLTLLMVLSLCACGGGSGSASQTAPTGSPTPMATPTPSPTPTPSTATMVVTAVSGSQSTSIPITVTIQP